MKMNRVQFQPGLPMPEFYQRYGTEAQCGAALEAARWPDGFVCPACGGAARTCFERGGLRYRQCGACHAFAFARYAHRYLAEFQYRFNRRFNMKTIMPRLLFALASAHMSGSSRWSLGKGGFRRGLSVSS